MLLRCIRAENRKLRRSPIWLLFLAVPAISAVYGTFNYNMNLEILSISNRAFFAKLYNHHFSIL